MRGIEDSWKITLFAVLFYGIYKTIKIIKNWKVSLVVTLVPMLIFTLAALSIESNILYVLSFLFIAATVINSYLTFLIYKDWEKYNNSMHVQYGYNPKLTLDQYYSEHI